MKPSRFCKVLPACMASALAAPAFAVDSPFEETFTGNTYSIGAPVFDDGRTPEGGDWSLSSDELVLAPGSGGVDQSAGGNRFAMWQLSDLPSGAGASFTMSTDFRIVEVDDVYDPDNGDLDRDIANVVRVGFAMFGENSEVNTAGTDVYYTYLSEFAGPESGGPFTPKLWNREFSDVAETTISDLGPDLDKFLDDGGADGRYFEPDTVYTYSVEVSYTSDTAIELTAKITDGSVTEIYSSLDDDPRTGDWFGLLGRTTSLFQGQIIFDNLSVAEGTLIEGDYDGNGFVSQSDLDLVLLNWGANPLVDGIPLGWDDNLPTDELISQNELDGVLLNWGSGTPPTFDVIPEPASMSLLALGVFGLGLGRTRRPHAAY